MESKTLSKLTGGAAEGGGAWGEMSDWEARRAAVGRVKLREWMRKEGKV